MEAHKKDTVHMVLQVVLLGWMTALNRTGSRDKEKERQDREEENKT